MRHDGAGKGEEAIVLFANDSLEKCRKNSGGWKVEVKKMYGCLVPIICRRE